MAFSICFLILYNNWTNLHTKKQKNEDPIIYVWVISTNPSNIQGAPNWFYEWQKCKQVISHYDELAKSSLFLNISNAFL